MNYESQIEALKEEMEIRNREIERLSYELNRVYKSRTWKYRNRLLKVLSVIKKPTKVLTKLGLSDKENNVKNYLQIRSNYQENIVYDDYQTDIKAIAFYLPQFHTFKENDKWWGKGFTEWTNTRKALPRYQNHYQPREPHDDIGYYDLSDINVLKKQIELAKQHGLYGFCYYYYWFSGKRLMEKVVDQLLDHPEIDFPFCLCWANENWTRTWDGQEKSVLIGQKYSKDDPHKFITDIKKYVMDKRYIRINGKPIIMVYNPMAIPNVSFVISQWKKFAIEEGIGEIYVICRNLILDKQKPIRSCDAEYDFVPLLKGFPSAEMSGVNNAHIFNYELTVNEMINLYKMHKPSKPFFYTSTMAWDNSARRKDNYNVFTKYSLEQFYNWNREIIRVTRKNHSKDSRFIFINAWNEWCEGTYLEPDKKYGYANINTLSKALFDLPFKSVKVINSSTEKLDKIDKKIAVQIHLFHIELTDEIIMQVNNIPYNYDVYISTNTIEKKETIERMFKEKSNAKNVVVEVTNNRGRDVAPFLIQFSKVYQNYDYICHIHSKMSKTVDYGNDWRHYTYKNLFGSQDNVKAIFKIFESNDNVGLIYPPVFPVVIDQISEYGRNKNNCIKLFKKLGIPSYFINEKLEFSAGTMFWAKVDAIKPLFEVKFKYKDFPKEAGQLDATLAHAIERIFISLANSRGYTYKNTYNNSIKYDVPKKKRLILFAHYDTNGKISSDDIKYLKALKKYSSDIVFISNEEVINNNSKISDLCKNILICNDGYDFGAWQKALVKYKTKIKDYDEIVFVNNSCYITNISFDQVFSEVDENAVKVLTVHAKDEDEDDSISYIKSDFMIFGRKVINNDKIIKEFLELEKCDSIMDKKVICNLGLTEILKEHKIKIDVFINETRYVDKYLINRPMELKHPLKMLTLGSPLLSKNVKDYILDKDKIMVEDFIHNCK